MNWYSNFIYQCYKKDNLKSNNGLDSSSKICKLINRIFDIQVSSSLVRRIRRKLGL